MYKQIKATILALSLTSGLVAAEHTQQEQPAISQAKQLVVFDLGALDTLDQLGIEVKAVPKQNLPNYLVKYKADEYADVGGLKTPNIDKVKAQHPDFIIISGRQQEQATQLATIASIINVSIDTKHYETSFKSNMHLLAKHFNKEAEMTKALANLDKEVMNIQQQANASTAKALILVHYNGKFVASEVSNYAGLVHDWLHIKAVGLASVRKDNNTPRIMLSDKDVASLNPDILFIIDRNEAIGEGKLNKQALEESAIKQTTAFQTKRIVYLTPDLWYLSGGGLESLRLQLAEVKRIFN